LLFLSQDGFRPISGTSNLDDVQLETISKSIQNTIREKCINSENEMSSALSVKIKSQVSFFFPVGQEESPTFLGWLKPLRDISQGCSKEC